MARFDWYEATVRTEPHALRDALLQHLPGEPSIEHLDRVPHGYGGGWLLQAEGETVARVWAGGTHAFPHVVFSGDDAHAGAEFLRTRYPGQHMPSRIDACEDFAEPGSYDVLQTLALGLAAERKLKIDTRGDHLLTKEGRTLMVGSTKSHAMLRLYDKAAELRAKFARDPVKLEAVPSTLARLELQIRPKGNDARERAAVVSPIEAFGAANWSRELMKRVSGLEIEPCPMGKVWRQSDDDRALAGLLAQYGARLRRMRDDLGSWDMVGRQLGYELEQRDAAKKRARGAS